MKILIISIFTILAMTVIIFSGVYWMRKNQVRTENELTRLRAVADSITHVQAKKDSIILELKKTIEAQDLVIQSRELEILKLNSNTKKIRNQYENIVFKSYANDSVRLRELSRHFPSLQNR